MNNNIITQKIQNRRVYRSRSTGRFVSVSTSPKSVLRNQLSTIRNGSLYSYRGQTVRALELCSNGLRLVGSHGTLFGFVKDSDLRKINGTDVKKYLDI